MMLRRPTGLQAGICAAGFLVLGLGLFFAVRAMLGNRAPGPSSPAQAQRQVWRYLKKQTRTSDFRDPSVNLDLKQDLTKAQTNLVLARQEMALLQSNLATARFEAQRLQVTNQNVREKLGGAAQEVRRVQEEVVDRERRFTNRLAELAVAGTNLFRAGTNAEAARTQTEALETRAFQASNEIAGLSQNASNLNFQIATVQSNLAAVRAESKAKATDLAARQQQLKTTQSDLATKKQRLEKKTNDTVLVEAIAAAQTNVARLEQEITGLKAAAATLGQDLTNRLENVAALQKELGGLQKTLAAKREDLASLRRQGTEKRYDLGQRERALAAAKAAVGTSQTNLNTVQTNLAAWQETLSAKRAALLARQKEFQVLTNSLAAKQQDVGLLVGKLDAKQKELPQRQRAIATMQEGLRYQIPNFRAQTGRQVAEASSYERIYSAIGKQLDLADRLLASQDAVERQQALSLAVQASQQALGRAEQGWLAARICEGWIAPNIALADERGRGDYTPEALLTHCQRVFTAAGEAQNAIHALRLALDRAPTNAPLRLDAARYQLGYALQEAGQYDEALVLYRAIESSNYVVLADPCVGTIYRLKERAASSER
jgi:predicted  nucleic acid-binding Zn-ribbon protein